MHAGARKRCRSRGGAYSRSDADSAFVLASSRVRLRRSRAHTPQPARPCNACAPPHLTATSTPCRVSESTMCQNLSRIAHAAPVPPVACCARGNEAIQMHMDSVHKLDTQTHGWYASAPLTASHDAHRQNASTAQQPRHTCMCTEPTTCMHRTRAGCAGRPWRGRSGCEQARDRLV